MQSKNLITVVYNVKAQGIFNRTRASVERYASNIGVDLVVHRSPNERFHLLDKYKLAKFAESYGYERVLMLDADVLVRTGENVFERTEGYDFVAKVYKKFEAMATFGKYDPKRFFNTAVLVADVPKLAAFADFAKHYNKGKCGNDEGLFNSFLTFAHTATTGILPERFHIWANHKGVNFSRMEYGAGFYHFSGHEKVKSYELWNEERKRRGLTW